jgi:Uma2 family endonuclease
MSTVLTPSDQALDADGLYEIVGGERVELPPMSAYAAMIASRLVSKLNAFAEPRGLGEGVSELLFRLPLDQERNRRPDVAFVTRERAKGLTPPVDANAWEMVPDLAVEVVSPTDFAEDLLQKADEYFRAGVRIVWVIYPRLRLIHVYESLTEVRGLLESGELDGRAVLPGFRLPLVELFPTPGAGAAD